jgi:hypothetical protein
MSYTPQTASTITMLLANRGLCRECIAAKAAMKPDAVDTAIQVLSRGVKIDHYANGTCAECGEEGPVYAIDRRSPWPV